MAISRNIRILSSILLLNLGIMSCYGSNLLGGERAFQDDYLIKDFIFNSDTLHRYCEQQPDQKKEKGKEPDLLAKTNMMIGVYWVETQPQKALNYFREAQKILKQTDNDTALLFLYCMMATTYDVMNDSENHQFYLKNALQKAIEINDKNIEVLVLHDLSRTYLCLDDMTMSEEYARMALSESERYNDYQLDNIMILKADIQGQKGDYGLSVKTFRKIMERVGGTRLEMVCLNRIAASQILMKQYQQADHALKESIRLNLVINDPLVYNESLRLMVKLNMETGDYKDAFRFQREIEKLNSSNYSLDEYSRKANEILGIELHELDSQLTKLNRTHLGKEARYASINILIFLLIIFAGVGSITLAWFHTAFKSLKQEKQRLLKDQESISSKKKKLENNYQELESKRNMLVTSNQLLEQTDRSKTELFKTISNDLQKPLVHLQEHLSELMVSDMDETDFRKATSRLTNTVGDVSLLLESLLQWSKYQSQGIKAKPQYIEMIMLTDDTISQQKYSAAEKSITLSNKIEQRLYVYADEEMIRGLLKTVIQNTIKLSSSQSVVTILGEKSDHNGVLKVSFRGKMPLKELYIQLFYTEGYDSDHSELGKAVSLGWMFCRAMINANKGTLRIEDISDEAYDIYITLPLEEYK